MAYWSLYKWFSAFRKSLYPDMIYYYSEYVLKTPEQREEERILREKRGKEALRTLGMMHAIISNYTDKDYWRYIK